MSDQTSKKRYTLDFLAQLLGITKSECLRLIMEEGTIKAIVVFPGGEQTNLRLGGLNAHLVNGKGQVSLAGKRAPIGNIRVDSVEAARVSRLRFLRLQSIAPLLKGSPETPAESKELKPGRQRETVKETCLEAWALNKPKRARGYGAAVYKYLKLAQDRKAPRPTAREVIEAFRDSPPVEIAKVLADSFDYYDVNGNTKTADLNAISKVISRQTRSR